MKSSYDMTNQEIDAVIDQALALPKKTKTERQTLAICTNKSATRSMAYGAAMQGLKDRGLVE